MAYVNKVYKLLTQDLTVPANTIYVDGTNFNSILALTEQAEAGALVIEATGGNSGCSKDVYFNFASSIDETNWDTVPYITLQITMSGTNKVRRTVNISCPIKYLKLLSVQNTETTAGYTATVNAYVYVKETYRV